MALIEPPDLRLIKDKNGELRSETFEEYKKRIEDARKERYEKVIKYIMDEGGFTRKQAEYLNKMMESISSDIRFINPTF